MNQSKDQKEIRIYIHWPFCLHKCPYCDFNSHEFKLVDLNYQKWIESYLQEFEFYKNFWHKKIVKSIYFGGGTPSLMHPNIIANIIRHIGEKAILDPNCEITLEANPTSIEIEKFYAFKEAGVNRVSIGIQSLRSEHLKFLGRKHSLNEAFDALKIANKVFGKRFSFDLIYGLPNQSSEEWKNDLKRILDMNFDNQHISLYQLTIEKGTKFFGMYKRAEFTMPNEEIQSQFYDITKEIMNDHGFECYEISNYAKSKEFQSVQNLGYWNYENYLGIGPGAHSRISFEGEKKVAAFCNVYNPEAWLKSINLENHLSENFENFYSDFSYKNNIPDNEFEKEKNVNEKDIDVKNLKVGCSIHTFDILKNHEILEEMILMGLRLKNGISQENIRKKFPSFKNLESMICQKAIEYLVSREFLRINENYFSLTEKGHKVCDYIIKKIIDNIISI